MTLISRLLDGLVAQNVPETRTSAAMEMVANATMSVCSNVHNRTATKQMLRDVNTTARRERPNSWMLRHNRIMVPPRPSTHMNGRGGIRPIRGSAQHQHTKGRGRFLRGAWPMKTALGPKKDLTNRTDYWSLRRDNESNKANPFQLPELRGGIQGRHDRSF